MSGCNPISILIVEDEAVTRKRLQAHCDRQGYTTEAVATKQEALDLLHRDRPQIVLLDVLLPDSSDFQLATRIGEQRNCGLMIISSLGDRDHRLAGLRAGADDYLNKPVDTEELLLKIANLASRIQPKAGLSQSFQFEGWIFAPDRGELCREYRKTVALTTKEQELLLIFVRSPRQLFSRDRLLALLSSEEDNCSDRAIDSRIARLRKKIEVNPRSPKILQSVYGGGYRFNAEVRIVDRPLESQIVS
ncbi:MAG: response regulator transcription factor [Cyanobacteria bacterium SBLK]|nr:response regulator transcription factor [Cyanobacteria bacterium SBLK]